MVEENMKETLGHKFRMINNGIDKHMSNAWSKEGHDMTRVQCSTLHYIKIKTDKGESVFQKDVEAQFAISGATASHILQSLEKKGLVMRQARKEDSRKKEILLTQEGIDTDAWGHVNIVRMEENLIKGFDVDEVRQFRGYLERVLMNLEELEKEL